MPSSSFRNTAAGALLVLALLLSGCAALVVGGGASGSYPAASKTAEQRSEDERISDSVRAALRADRMLAGADITVQANEGVVKLDGVVASYTARSQAETLTASVSGVRGIDNRLKIKNIL